MLASLSGTMQQTMVMQMVQQESSATMCHLDAWSRHFGASRFAYLLKLGHWLLRVRVES